MADSGDLEALLDHTQDVIAILDDAGRMTYVNAAVERILGYLPDELVGDIAFEYIHRDDVANAVDAFERTISTASFVETTVEIRFEDGDGDWVWLECRMTNLTDGDLEGYVVSARDVTDRVAAERSRAETASRLDELASISGDVFWMFEADWSELLYLNGAYETVYGQPVAAVEADPTAFLETVHPDDVDRVESAMERLVAGETVDLEYRVNPREDYAVWVWVKGHPVVEDGEVERITGFSRDVTDRRRREQQLYVMDNLLRHNIRNALTKILNNVDLVERETPAAGGRTAVIRRACNDLLSTAEKERDVIDLLTSDAAPRPLDLAEVLERCRAEVLERHPSATIEVDCPSAARARALRELGAAITELLENGIRHGEADAPAVRVDVDAPGADGEDGTVDVVVEDDGPPLPDIEASVLTGEDQMGELYHGSGLGLWLVHWVVELSRGEIAIESRTEQGNRIRLSLQAPVV